MFMLSDSDECEQHHSPGASGLNCSIPDQMARLRHTYAFNAYGCHSISLVLERHGNRVDVDREQVYWVSSVQECASDR